MQIAKDMSDAGPGFNTKETTMKRIILAASLAASTLMATAAVAERACIITGSGAVMCGERVL